MGALFDLLKEPGIDAIDIDGERRIALHRAVLERKPMIRDVFLEFHRLFAQLDQRYLAGKRHRGEMARAWRRCATAIPMCCRAISCSGRTSTSFSMRNKWRLQTKAFA